MRKIRANKKGISALLAVTLLAIIVLCATVVTYLYIQMQAPPGDRGVEDFYGTVSVTITEDNFLDRGASVSTTSDSYIAYHAKGKTLDEAVEDDFVGGASFTVGTAKNVAIDPEDDGHFFLKAYTGTDFYLQIQSSQDTNPRVASYKYVDVDNDNRLEVVFDIDVSDIAPPDPNTNPSLDISVIVVAEDGTTALNSPADQSSIGSGTKTGTIEWQLSGIAEKTGEGLARVYVVQNRTQEDMMSVTSVEIDQVGLFSGGDISYDSGAKAWYVNIGITDYKELAEAFILTRPAGGKSYVGITVSWESYFTATNQTVSMTLYVETMDADESVNSALSDAVLLVG